MNYRSYWLWLGKTTSCNWYRNCLTEILRDKANEMKTLSDLAEEYERWAAEDDSIISGIMSNVDALADGVRQEQLRRATLLAEQARNLRDDAKRLRRSVGYRA